MTNDVQIPTSLKNRRIAAIAELVGKLTTPSTAALMHITDKPYRNSPIVSNMFSVFSNNVGIGKALMESNIAL